MIKYTLIFMMAIVAVSCSKEDDTPPEPVFPEYYTISSITLSDIPAGKTDGTVWDIGSTPDVYIDISYGNTENRTTTQQAMDADIVTDDDLMDFVTDFMEWPAEDETITLVGDRGTKFIVEYKAVF